MPMTMAITNYLVFNIVIIIILLYGGGRDKHTELVLDSKKLQ